MTKLEKALFVGMVIMVVAIVIAGQVQKEKPEVYNPADILILSIEPMPSLHGRNIWYVEYVVGHEPFLAALPTEEHAGRFIDWLRTIGIVTFLWEAK